MHQCDRNFFQEKYNDAKGHNTIKRQCAYSDLIEGDSFSNCEHCIWSDYNIDEFYYSNTPMCNRYDDLCIE